MNWRVVDDGFYYVERPPDAFSQMAFYHFEKGISHIISTLPSKSGCLRADVAPDGSWLAFARVDHGGRDLALIEMDR